MKNKLLLKKIKNKLIKRGCHCYLSTTSVVIFLLTIQKNFR